MRGHFLPPSSLDAAHGGVKPTEAVVFPPGLLLEPEIGEESNRRMNENRGCGSSLLRISGSGWEPVRGAVFSDTDAGSHHHQS